MHDWQLTCSSHQNWSLLRSDACHVRRPRYESYHSHRPLVPDSDGVEDVDHVHRAGRQRLAALTRHPIRTRLSRSSPMIVARDIAHAKIKERLDAGEEMPQYLRDHPVYYAGPAKTPEGYASGSFGPTTAGRMDSYVAEFQAAAQKMVPGSNVMTPPCSGFDSCDQSQRAVR